jgi:hypothetical protein
VLFFLLLALLAAPVFARAVSAEELDFTYRLNFNTGFHYDRWNVLSVTVQNRQGQDWQGTVAVEYNGAYEAEIFAAAGLDTTVLFFLPPGSLQDYFQQPYLSSSSPIRIKLINSGGSTVKAKTAVAVPAETGYYIGVFSSRPEHFGRLANLADGAVVVPLENSHLEHELCLESFAVIIISDLETLRLKREQSGRLAAWVERGGLLVIGGGRGWQKNIADLPDGLLPFKPDGTALSGGLQPVGGDFSFSDSGGDYLFSTGTVRGGVLLAAAEHPLLVGGRHGRGTVLYSTLNLEDPPFHNAHNFEAFWGYLLYANLEHLAAAPRASAQWYFSEIIRFLAFGNINVGLLSPGKVLLGLLLYIFLIGPVNYFVLKRLQRWEWAWFTIPALALLFTAATYFVAAVSRTSELTNYQVNVIEIYHEHKAVVQSYTAVFVPRRKDLLLTYPLQHLAAGPGVTVTAGAPPGTTTLKLANPPLWSLRRAYGKSGAELAGALRAAVDLTRKQPEVLLVNHTGFDLIDSYVRLGVNWYGTGELKSGAQKSVPLTQAGYVDLSGVLQRYAAKGAGQYYPHFGLEELFDYSAGLTLLGFSDSPAFFAPEGAASVVLNILIASTDTAVFNLAPAFDLPEGWLIPKVIARNDAAAKEPFHPSGQDRYFSGTGHVDLVYNLPPGIDYSRGAFKLNFGGGYHENSIVITAYNHAAGAWTAVGEVHPRAPQVLHLSNLPDLVREDRLLIRIAYNGELTFAPGRLLSIEGGGLK